MIKTFQRIFYIFLGLVFLIFIGILFNFYNNQKFPFRKLNYSNDDVEKICKNISPDVYEFFYNDHFFFELPPIKNDTEYIDSFSEIIELKLKKKSFFKKYFKFYSKYFVFILISFSLFIFWINCIIFGIIFKCKKCCNCCENKKLKDFSLFSIIIVLSINFFFSIITILSLKKLNKKNNNISCSILKLINEIKEGQNINTNFKWTGIKNIRNLIQNLDTLSPKLVNQISNYKQNITDLNNKYNIYINELFNVYQKVKTMSTDNYIKDINLAGSYKNKFSNNPVKLIPSFMLKYGPHSEINTTLYFVKYEMDLLKNNLTYINEAIKETFDNKDFKNELNYIQNDLLTFENTIEIINNQIIIPWYNKHKNNTKYIKFLFLIDILYIVFDLILIISLFILNSKYLSELKISLTILIHIFWNLLSILIIIGFTIGIIVVIFGKEDKDLINLINMITKSENIFSENPKIIPDLHEDGKSNIDICLNGNGDLTNDIFGKTGNYLHDLLSIETYLNSSIIYLKEREYPMAIEKFEKYITDNNLIIEFMEIPYYIFHPNQHLYQYNENESIDFKKSINEINEVLSIMCPGKSLIDKWTTTRICPNYYNLHSSRLEELLSGKYFIYLYTEDWWEINPDILYSRYSSSCYPINSFGYSINQYEASKEFYQMFKNVFIKNKSYMKNWVLLNKNIPSSPITYNDIVRNAFKDIQDDLIKYLHSALDIIIPIRKFFLNNINIGNFDSMLNCDFVKTNLNFLLRIYYDLGNDVYNNGIYLTINSFILCFGIIFIIINVNLTYTENYKKNKNVIIKKNQRDINKLKSKKFEYIFESMMRINKRQKPNKEIEIDSKSIFVNN